MRIKKEKRSVHVVCCDDFSIKGVIHINPGERVYDFINDRKEAFIVITEVQFSRKLHRPVAGWSPRENTLILNKSVIRWVEEL